MKKEAITTNLFSISCENQKGILSRLIAAFDRPGWEIATLSQAQTDVSGIIIVNIEAAIPDIMADHMLLRLKRIIGVFDVLISFGSVTCSAVYEISLNAFKIRVGEVLNRHNARIISLDPGGRLLIHQIATVKDIQRLYNELDHLGLVSFSQLALPVGQSLSWEDLKDTCK